MQPFKWAGPYFGSSFKSATGLPVATSKTSTAPVELTNPVQSGFIALMGTALASYSFFHTSLLAAASKRRSAFLAPVASCSSTVPPRMR